MRAGAYAWPGHATKQVAFVGPDLHVHELWVPRGGDWSQADLTARATGISGGGRGAPPVAASGDLVAYAWPDGGTKQVAYVGEDRHVYELFVGGSASDWMWGDLTALTGCPPVRRQTESLTVGMAWSGGHTKQVAYVGDDGHIHELSCGVDGAWRHADLHSVHGWPWTVVTTRSAMSGFSYSDRDHNRKVIVAMDTRDHLHVAWVDPGRAWDEEDEFRDEIAVREAYALAGFATGGFPGAEVAWIGENDHIHTLPFGTGDTAHPEFPPADIGKGTSGFPWSGQRTKQVVYASADGHVHELVASADGERWTEADLTARAAAGGAVGACDLVIAGYDWPDDGAKQVAYRTREGAIRELSVRPGGDWSDADLSARTGAPAMRR